MEGKIINFSKDTSKFSHSLFSFQLEVVQMKNFILFFCFEIIEYEKDNKNSKKYCTASEIIIKKSFRNAYINKKIYLNVDIC